MSKPQIAAVFGDDNLAYLALDVLEAATGCEVVHYGSTLSASLEGIDEAKDPVNNAHYRVILIDHGENRHEQDMQDVCRAWRNAFPTAAIIVLTSESQATPSYIQELGVTQFNRQSEGFAGLVRFVCRALGS